MYAKMQMQLGFQTDIETSSEAKMTSNFLINHRQAGHFFPFFIIICIIPLVQALMM